MRTLESLITALPLKDMGPDLLAENLRALYPSVRMDEAVRLASYLHRNQTRANRGLLPRDMYVTHPFRNALRLHRYGVKDEALIIAAVLHDTIEDCADEMTNLHTHSYDPLTTSSRFIATEFLRFQFGPKVERLVLAVTNPLPDPTAPAMSKADKRAAYAAHVTAAIVDPEVALIKFADFVDNAFGLKHNDLINHTGMVSHLSQKYLPFVPVFEKRVSQPDVRALLSLKGYRQIEQQITEGGVSLAQLAILR